MGVYAVLCGSGSVGEGEIARVANAVPVCVECHQGSVSLYMETKASTSTNFFKYGFVVCM